MQLNKYLALCGVASRRKSNEPIIQGRVKVNGDFVQELGCVVDPENDRISLDGILLEFPETFCYFLLNKPSGVITSAVDGRGRKTVLDLVASRERIFPVGRLDYDTEGVLLLTNDGELAYRLTHPKFEMEKVYEAWVEGKMTGEAVAKLRHGVAINPGLWVSGETRIIKREANRTLIEIRIHEGKKRQIKRMMKVVRFPVIHLTRTVFAGLEVNDLKVGQYRTLTDDEVDTLYRITGLKRNAV